MINHTYLFLAYIDPGQGTLIWQAIASSAVGFFFYLKKTRGMMVGLFFKIFGRRKIDAKTHVSESKTETR